MAKKKEKVMIVKTLGDAVELINHNTTALEHAIEKVAKKKNRGLKFLCIAALACAVYTAVECRKQDEELYRLSIRVRKLENEEGE